MTTKQQMTDWRQGGGGGVWYVPHSLHGGVRHGHRERDDAQEGRDV